MFFSHAINVENCALPSKCWIIKQYHYPAQSWGISPDFSNSAYGRVSGDIPRDFTTIIP